MQRQITRLMVNRVWSIQWCRLQWPWVTINLDFKITGLLLMPSTYCVHAQLTRDLLAIAKFLFPVGRTHAPQLYSPLPKTPSPAGSWTPPLLPHLSRRYGASISFLSQQRMQGLVVKPWKYGPMSQTHSHIFHGHILMTILDFPSTRSVLRCLNVLNFVCGLLERGILPPHSPSFWSLRLVEPSACCLTFASCWI